MPISLETIYKEIARELFAEFPDAHWGPGHVCLEDGNWGAYQQAIDFATWCSPTVGCQRWDSARIPYSGMNAFR